MNTKQQIDQLWEEMRESINQAYRLAEKSANDEIRACCCLRDYAQNISWSDNLAALLGRELANEKQHRSNRPAVKGFPSLTAAKLIIMDNIADGADAPDMPKATLFLTIRQTAAESMVIGWLVRHLLTEEWAKSVRSLDYAALMQNGEAGCTTTLAPRNASPVPPMGAVRYVFG